MWPSTSARKIVPEINEISHSVGSGRRNELIRRTFSAHAEVDRLYNINKRFVLLVFDICSTPARRTRSLTGDLG